VRNAEGARRNNELATIAAWHCGKLRTSKDNKAERRDENSIPTAARPRLRISHLLYTIFTPSCEYKLLLHYPARHQLHGEEKKNKKGTASSSVTTVTLGSRLFFILLQINSASWHLRFRHYRDVRDWRFADSGGIAYMITGQ
jgi:hypothetical protein